MSDQHEYPGHLKLKFSTNISGPIYTGLPIGDQEGRTLDLHLIDSHTQNIINSGPEASGEVEIVLLEKDFTSFGGDNSLLGGNPLVSLKNASVSVSHVSFKHTRVPMRNRELRLGARVVYPRDIRTRIVEAVTEPFFVKSRRSMGKSLKALFLDDQVWKLQNIGKGSAFHNRLMMENILTVGDFLTNYFLNRENLLTVPQTQSFLILTLGRHMHGKKLDAAVNQAKVILDLKRYVYPHENSRVLFTDVGELIGVKLYEGQFVPVEQFTQIQKDLYTGMMKGIDKEEQGLYILKGNTLNQASQDVAHKSINTAEQVPTSTTLWHRRLGHASLEVLKRHTILRKLTYEDHKCIICPLAKHTKLAFPISSSSSKSAFELLYCDIWVLTKFPLIIVKDSLS